MRRTLIISEPPTAVDQAKNADSVEKSSNGNSNPHHLEYQNSLNLSPETQQILAESNAYVYKKESDGMLLIKSVKGDPVNPRSWPNWKRYAIVGLASFLNNLVSHPSLPSKQPLYFSISHSIYPADTM